MSREELRAVVTSRGEARLARQEAELLLATADQTGTGIINIEGEARRTFDK